MRLVFLHTFIIDALAIFLFSVDAMAKFTMILLPVDALCDNY